MINKEIKKIANSPWGTSKYAQEQLYHKKKRIFSIWYNIHCSFSLQSNEKDRNATPSQKALRSMTFLPTYFWLFAGETPCSTGLLHCIPIKKPRLCLYQWNCATREVHCDPNAHWTQQSMFRSCFESRLFNTFTAPRESAILLICFGWERKF